MSKIIYAKASLSHDQIQTKLRIGCDGIEIQLLGELLGQANDHDWLDISDCFTLSEFAQYPIRAVHAPLIPGHGDTLIERLVDDLDKKLLVNIFAIADYFGKAQGVTVPVVMHSETYLEYLQDIGNSWNRLFSCVSYLLQHFDSTELLIENVSPLRGIGKGKDLHFANNCMFDNIELVRTLRKELQTNRIGTVLDTCHQMLADKYIGILYDAVGDVDKPDLSMERYFEENAPYLKLMHVCDMVGSGYGKGRHGVPFNDDSYDKLVNILTLHDKYCPDVPMTLEVEEMDFSVCNGFKETKELIEKFYQEAQPGVRKIEID